MDLLRLVVHRRLELYARNSVFNQNSQILVRSFSMARDGNTGIVLPLYRDQRVIEICTGCLMAFCKFPIVGDLPGGTQDMLVPHVFHFAPNDFNFVKSRVTALLKNRNDICQWHTAMAQ